MRQSIKISTYSTDREKIKTVKKWIKKTRISHEGRMASQILVPLDLSLAPQEISEYAAAINTIIPDERVTDYHANSFITVKKELFFKAAFNNSFYQDYYMELDEEKNIWSIVPPKDRR